MLLPSFLLFNCVSYPTIIIHGIASNKNELEYFANSLEIQLHYKVYNIEVGNGELTSIFMNINQQCEILANNIKNLDLEDNKINLIGFSQGGLLARCYTQLYSDNIIQVNTLITIASPNMGIYYNAINILPVVNYYWKDPFKYQETNNFILFLNNEKQHHNYEKYKTNIKLLSNLVIIWSSIDKVIIPLESSKFEFYNIDIAIHDKKLEIQNLEESSFYINDSLGFKYLKSNNKLNFYNINCNHEEFKLPKCFNKTQLLKIIVNYIK